MDKVNKSMLNIKANKAHRVLLLTKLMAMCLCVCVDERMSARESVPETIGIMLWK